MLDPRRVAKAEAERVAFVCRMCTKWYLGEDLGLKDVEGDKMCASNGLCGSPVGGKGFDEYQGPLQGHLDKFCYICGRSNPQKALEPRGRMGRRIGCCNHCFENEVKKIAVRQMGRRVILVSAEKAGPDKFEEIE